MDLEVIAAELLPRIVTGAVALDLLIELQGHHEVEGLALLHQDTLSLLILFLQGLKDVLEILSHEPFGGWWGARLLMILDALLDILSVWSLLDNPSIVHGEVMSLVVHRAIDADTENIDVFSCFKDDGIISANGHIPSSWLRHRSK